MGMSFTAGMKNSMGTGTDFFVPTGRYADGHKEGITETDLGRQYIFR